MKTGTGTIKFYDSTAGWGFVKCEEVDYFFHISDARLIGEPELVPGLPIGFDIVENDRGLKVTNMFKRD